MGVDEADEFQEMSLGELFQAEVYRSHPIPGASECKGIGSKGGVGETSKGAGVEKRVDRFNLSPFGVNQSVGRRTSSIRVEDDEKVTGVGVVAVVHRNCFISSRSGCSPGSEDRLTGGAGAGDVGIFCR